MSIYGTNRAARFMRRSQGQRGWGYRFLPLFKTINGRRFQLHATRGWKCIGRAAE